MKLFILVFLLAVISGCIAGEKKGITEEVIMQNISISSEAFREGGNIPSKYTCDGTNVSPALSWNGAPEGTKSITLILDDPDAPGGTFVHWVLFNIPAGTQRLPEAVPANWTLSDGSRHGTTSFGARKIGYGGPCPPPGKPHRYYFSVYALDTKLDLPAGATRADVERAMGGHILAKGELMGKYGR